MLDRSRSTSDDTIPAILLLDRALMRMPSQIQPLLIQRLCTASLALLRGCGAKVLLLTVSLDVGYLLPGDLASQDAGLAKLAGP